jgi:asparagine synthase (glutamine-hydrolysing)
MSGVFGIVSSENNVPALAEILGKMENTLALRSWHKVRSWTAESGTVGLGQAHIGIFAAQPQPVFSADGALAAVFFGECTNADALRRSLRDGAEALPPGDDAALVLKLYEHHGLDLPARLEGVFTLAIWDGRRRRLLLANDRYGLLPHYYCHTSQRLLFGPLVATLLCDPSVPRRLNLDALADFTRFQRLLGDKTFLDDVHLLPYGSRLVYERDTNSLTVSHYWDFDQIPTLNPAPSFDEAVVETARLLRNSVQNDLSGPDRKGVFLSGGLDSRTALGIAAALGQVLPSVTYGHPRSTDVAYARQVARAVGSTNSYIPQEDGMWLLQHTDFHLAATEGFTSFLHGHAANALEPARQILDINLTGFNGDQLMGARAIEHGGAIIHAVDETAFLVHMYHSLTQEFSWPGATDIEERLLYLPSFYPQVRDRAFESMRQSLAPFSQFPYERRLDYFTAVYQGSRLSNLNVVYHRSYFETRYPFYDYPLIDFVHALPTSYRVHDRLYLAVINRLAPKVTWTPRDTDDMLITDQKAARYLHGLGVKAFKRLRRWVMPGYASQRLHGDPEDWLRNDLHEWVAGILFDQRTIERGIFNPIYMKSIFERHMSGREIWTIGKIAPLVTFELMMRRYFDQASSDA